MKITKRSVFCLCLFIIDRLTTTNRVLCDKLVLNSNSSQLTNIESIDLIAEMPSRNNKAVDIATTDTGTSPSEMSNDKEIILLDSAIVEAKSNTSADQETDENDETEREESRTRSQQQSSAEIDSKSKSNADAAHKHNPSDPDEWAHVGDVCRMSEFCPTDIDSKDASNPGSKGSKSSQTSDRLVSYSILDLHQAYHANKNLAILDRHLLSLQKLCPHLVTPNMIHLHGSQMLFLAPSSGCNPTELIRLVQLMKIANEKFAKCASCFEYAFKPLLCGFASKMVMLANYNYNAPNIRSYPLPFVASPTTFYADDAWQNSNEALTFKK